MKIAVVGHLEWGRFVRVDRIPLAGEIIRAQESWEEVAGGGSVAAMQIAELNGSCVFFTAVGSDKLGTRGIEQLQQRGIEVYATIAKDQSTKSAIVHTDSNGERTITVSGNLKQSGTDATLPWEMLSEMDAVYFVNGDATALEHARKAKTLVSTARILPLLQQTALPVDVLLASAKDEGEKYRPGDLSPEPALVIMTDGSKGGTLSDGTRYAAETVAPESLIDTYGCGDSFAAGLTYGLSTGADTHEALKIAIQTGALAAQRRGAFGS